jgi:hypothetical protein
MDQLEVMCQVFANVCDLFLIFPHSIGETTCMASCLIEWKRIHKKDIIVLTSAKTQEKIFSMYKEIKVIHISNDLFNKLMCKKVSFINYVDNVYKGNVKEQNMYQLIKKSMNVPLSFSHHKCDLEDIHIENAKKILADFEWEANKTILCIPFANCLGEDIVSQQFWPRFCHEASLRGYKVIFNSDKPIVQGVPYCFLSFPDVLALSTLCKGVVSVRTGLIDFIAANSSNNNIYVIYPGDTNEIWQNVPQIFINLKQCFDIDDNKSLVDNYIESASLKMFSESVKEYKNNTEDKIIQDIINVI